MLSPPDPPLHPAQPSRSSISPLCGAVLALALGSTLVGCDSLDVQQRRWIFQARAIPVGTSPGPTVTGMEDVWIEHDSAASGRKIQLHGVWHPAPDAKAPLLLYLHGARRNVEGSAFRIRQMGALGFSVLAVDYRGFGLSTDELPSEAAVYEDARAAWDWLARMRPGAERYIFGHSLGGAIAVQLATEAPQARGLIVEGTFTSIADVARSMKWGWLPFAPLLTQRFDSLGKIERVKMPVLVVHGSRDTLVPPALGQALYERAAAPKRLLLVDGGSHYNTNSLGAAQYRGALQDLFRLGTRPAPIATVE